MKNNKKDEKRNTYLLRDLKVVDAMQQDIGRGLVRLDPADINAIGLKVGDVIEIKGTRATVARVVPTHTQQRGQHLVALDETVRNNCNTELGQLVSLRPITVDQARSITLVPEPGDSGRDVSGHQLSRLLQGIPVVTGDLVKISSYSSHARHFIVKKTQPTGPVLITNSTYVRFGGETLSGSRITAYEDIGGLKRELASIREMIELPLKSPQVFEQLGINAPKGVLIYGPPGCGKTLIARAVAHEADAQFFSLSGPEIMHKHYGESEAHLRKVFEEASKAPGIIFIDEIDAIAPKRNALGSEQQVERRVVSQLLTLMDGLVRRGQVVVIGATNLPDSIDPALRRPGRFDREIAIGAPDRIGRQEILEVHTRGMPLAEDVNLEQLATVTHGFVGADLQSLAQEAAMAHLRRLFRKQELQFDNITDELLDGLRVEMEDFHQALAVVEPSAIREIFCDIPSVKWEEVGGLSDIKQLLDEVIQWPLMHSDLFRTAGISSNCGVLLNGPPGVGKTLIAKALATECGVNFISVNSPSLMNKWIGESERAIREIFQKVRLASPCILFLDEVDSITPGRGSNNASAVTDRIIAQLLTEMDGIEGLSNVQVLAATNRKDLIDPALLRAGRFDYVIDLPLPGLKARREIYRVHTQNKPIGPDVHLEELAASSKGYSGADIELHCRKASLLGIRDFFAGGFDPTSQADRLIIKQTHFVASNETRS